MLDEDSDESKLGYTMKLHWLFGIGIFLLVVWHLNMFCIITTRMMLENPALLNHKCVGIWSNSLLTIYGARALGFARTCRRARVCKVLARSGVCGRADVRACARAWPCLRDSM